MSETQPTTVRTIRASSVPRAILCPPSEREGLQIDGDNESARLGSAVHRALSALVTVGAMPTLGDIANDFGLSDPDELRQLAWYGSKCWDELRQWFPNPLSEQHMELALNDAGDLLLSGHCDVFSEAGGELRILDWKSGRKQHDFIGQLKAYGLLAAHHCREMPRTVSCTTVWLRDGCHDTRRFEIADVLAFREELAAALSQAGTENYRTGEHCEHCGRFHDCPARAALVRRAIADIGGGITADSILALGDRIPEIRAGVKCLKAACEQFDAAFREAVAQSPSGEMTAGGRTYFLSTVNKRQIDTLKGWPVLLARLSEEELAPAVKVSITAVEQAVADKAWRGQKTAAKKELSEALESAGALNIKEETRLADRPAGEKAIG